MAHKPSSLNRFGVPLLLVFAALLPRMWALYFSDLPAGDEVNTYIANGQSFAESIVLPAISSFPMTTIAYGTVVKALNIFSVPLPGLITHYIVSILAGVLSSLIVFFGIKQHSGDRLAFICAVIIAAFPGTFFVFRADISLYFILMPLLTASFLFLTENPRYQYALLPGVIGGLFYLSRSDGLIIFLVSLGMFILIYPRYWKQLVMAGLVFAVCIFGYQAGQYIKTKKWSGGVGGRALFAFYQAEGLHDRKGGDWHQFYERGVKRFGPEEQYDGSLIKVVLNNPKAVIERASNNLNPLVSYLKKTSPLPGWLIGVIICAGCIGRYRRLLFLYVGPPLLTTCIYMIFYFQPSYFTLLSYSIALGLGVGISTLLELVRARYHGKTRVTGWLIPAVAGCFFLFFCYQTAQLYPARKTTAYRYWGALHTIKALCRNQSENCFFTPPYRGSKSMPIFTNLPTATVEFGPVSRLAENEQRDFLAASGVHYLLCGIEHRTLWQAKDREEDLLFINARRDVKIATLAIEADFRRAAQSLFRFSATPELATQEPGGIVPFQDAIIAGVEGSLLLGTQSNDGSFLLPVIKDSRNTALVIAITIESPFETDLKLYLKRDPDAGFTEPNSVRKRLIKGINEVYLSIPLESSQSGKPVILRLDPGTIAGNYYLHELDLRGI